MMGPFSTSRPRSAAAALLSASLWAAGLSACLSGGEGKSGNAQVKPELMRVVPPAVKVGLAAPGIPAAPAWSSALAISSFKVPLRRITLYNASFTRSADIYTCLGSGVECEVEAAGQPLRNELDADAAAVEPGEYRYIVVKACDGEDGEYTASLTATVSLNGKVRHTHPTAILDSSGPARPLFIKAKGCSRTYALPRPVVIPANHASPIPFKLYFDLEDLAHAALGSRNTARAWSADRCAGSRPAESDAPGDPFVCIGYPELSGLVDSMPPILERYRINGGATLGLFFTGQDAGIPVGGYTRRFFREGFDENPGFNAGMPLRDLSGKEDGRLSLAAFGVGYMGQLGSEFKVEAFQRATHDGEHSGLPDSAGVGTAGTYRAERL